MPNTLGKNLHLCFSLIKRPQPQITHTPQTTLNNHQNHNSPFIKNYNSLYEDSNNNNNNNNNPPPPTTTYASAPVSPSSASTDYMETEDTAGSTTPDLAAAYASRRFFISSPGRSNSIVDSLSLSSSSTLLSPLEESTPAEAAGGVAVQTYSPDPYVDFRRSMQEMVESRDLGSLEVKEAWEYLQELLLSYLALNPKNTHKYIVGAFTDLVVSLMSPNNNYQESGLPSSSSSSSFSSSYGGEGDHNNGGKYV